MRSVGRSKGWVERFNEPEGAEDKRRADSLQGLTLKPSLRAAEKIDHIQSLR